MSEFQALMPSPLAAQLGAFDATVSFAPSKDRFRFSLFDPWVRVPERTPTPAPRTQVLARSLRRQTGWSQRKLANVLRSTHPTVRALEEGRSSAQQNELYDQLVGVHEVVDRVFELAGRDSRETNRLLSATTEESTSALDLLTAGDFAAAYLAAVDAARPRRSSLMMQGIWKSTPGTATHSLEAADPH